MNNHPKQSAVTLRWETSHSRAQAVAAFAARVIGSDARYISHGEVQTGLSPDGKVWAEHLAELYEQDFLDIGEQRDMLLCLDEDFSIVAMAILSWEESNRRRFAVLEDMAVDPEWRSQRIGEQMLAEVESRVRERDVKWLFLESGLKNQRAHHFFERHGFETISHVFVKQLDSLN